MKPSSDKRWWGLPLWERWRNRLWRHRVLASMVYLLMVSTLPAFLWLYPRVMPAGLDLGLTVAVRHWLHQRPAHQREHRQQCRRPERHARRGR